MTGGEVSQHFMVLGLIASSVIHRVFGASFMSFWSDIYLSTLNTSYDYINVLHAFLLFSSVLYELNKTYYYYVSLLFGLRGKIGFYYPHATIELERINWSM